MKNFEIKKRAIKKRSKELTQKIKQRNSRSITVRSNREK